MAFGWYAYTVDKSWINNSTVNRQFTFNRAVHFVCDRSVQVGLKWILNTVGFLIWPQMWLIPHWCRVKDKASLDVKNKYGYKYYEQWQTPRLCLCLVTYRQTTVRPSRGATWISWRPLKWWPPCWFLVGTLIQVNFCSILIPASFSPPIEIH